MLSHLKEELDKFRKRIITEARKNLTRQKKKASGSLYKNLDSELEVYKSNNFMLSFELGSYGEFVDNGVSGTKKKYNTPFRFGTGTGKKGGLRNGISKWIRQKGIKGRGKDGRFISNKSLTFLISRSIYTRGLKPSLYFTRPFQNEFKKLSDDLVEAFGLDIDEFLKYTLNKYE